MRESDLKRSVEERLQWAKNQGQVLFLRLNSGAAYLPGKTGYYKIQLCPPGTADFVVWVKIYPTAHNDYWYIETIFIELKSGTGEQSPEQIEFEKEVKEFGLNYYVIRKTEELESILKG